MVNAQEFEEQRLRQDVESHAKGFNNNVLNPNRVEVEDEKEERLFPQQKMLAPRGRDIDGARETRVIVLPPYSLGVKFTIINTMIHLLNLEGLFRETIGEDSNQHLMNFVRICKPTEILEASQKVMRLRLFPLSLTGEATNWLNELPHDSITNWEEFKETFIERFYPKAKELQLKNEIGAHKKLP
ncbi:hypothetical protein R3W88_001056 [Solanum pinnatisectum]|uniref:Retrotransposon gag domain-containing protein n=1 Tax=Solanum pinnatisectum TaxID=50273 RepID=A0AAV9MK33_9SOLN|nr:hypothetical protein R3W88_001056 [Solanum pinnatisectum]